MGSVLEHALCLTPICLYVWSFLTGFIGRLNLWTVLSTPIHVSVEIFQMFALFKAEGQNSSNHSLVVDLKVMIKSKFKTLLRD